MKPRHRFVPLVATAMAGLLSIGLTACGGSGDSGGTQSKSGYKTLTMVDGAQTLSAFNAPYGDYAPKHAWKTAGIGVDVQLVQGGTQSAQLVATGKADVSIVGLSSALAVAAQSPNVKIVAVTGGNIWHLAVPKDSSVTSIDQLKGKTIGVQALNTGSYLYNRAALKLDGMSPDKDVKWLPIGTGAQAAQAVNSKQVAAVATYDGPYEVLSGLTKGGMRVLPSPLDELDGSGAWIVNAKTLESHRDQIVKFIRGMSETSLVAQSAPEDIIEELFESHPDTKPRGVSDADAVTQTKALVKAYWSKIADMGPEGAYGVLSDAQIAAAVKFHEDAGMVEGKIDIAKTFDLSVSEEADKYDRAASLKAQTSKS
ncbi:ABC transporter substrate-binding protein [Streptomyces sp. NPDC047070]|uniref:ABC transporter substrate-binding protein n=1 Tax=Streptomyces sp. NPDC047070 TaxID=3154923 RepID=UPI003452E22E